MRSRFVAPLVSAGILVGCSTDLEPIPKDFTTDPPPMTPPALPVDMPREGTIPILLTADGAGASNAVVSFGLPFPQGVIGDERALTLRNAKNEPVPMKTRALARWPGDGSLRSVGIVFATSLSAGASEPWSVMYGTPSRDAERSPDAGALEANPDGPIVVTLTPDHYAKSRVSGVILPVAANARFPDYDANMQRGDARFDVAQFGVDCNAAAGRTYYDGPHARYQRFLRSGVVAQYRAARREAVWYRENELAWYADHTLAIHVCEPGNWSPDRGMDWGTIRQMYAQGMLDDWLVTGDPRAREALDGIGEAYRVSLGGLDGELEITERNLGWTLIGLASYFAIDPRNEVRDAARRLVERAIDWQSRGTSGALEHDIVRPDPDECGDGPSGASPFMTSIVVDGVMDWWLLTADTKLVEPFVRKLAVWYETQAITSDKKAFRYLWNCNTEPYDSPDYADLNVLIGHVFGAAYVLTRDKHWVTFGDGMATTGIDAMYAGSPKHFNQAGRAFGKYLGYRAVTF